MDLEALRAALADAKIKPPRYMYIIAAHDLGLFYTSEKPQSWSDEEDEAKRFESEMDLPDEIDRGTAHLAFYMTPDGPNGERVYTYMENARCKTSEEKVYAKAYRIKTNIY